MKAQYLDSTTIQGFTVRTNNATEMSPHGKISALWGAFYEHIGPRLTEGQTLFGVYCHYESDASGDFDVVAGIETSIKDTLPSQLEQTYEAEFTLKSVTLEAGNYLEFAANGEMPQAIIQAWQTIWTYFRQEDCPHQRAYTTDFECYTDEHTASVFIAITN